jgi:hypothetical protein
MLHATFNVHHATSMMRVEGHPHPPVSCVAVLHCDCVHNRRQGCTRFRLGVVQSVCVPLATWLISGLVGTLALLVLQLPGGKGRFPAPEGAHAVIVYGTISGALPQPQA